MSAQRRTTSFFFNDRQSNDEVSALIDGRFYFEYKPDEAKAAEPKKETPKETPNVAAPDALSVLKAANRVHGGAKLDNQTFSFFYVVVKRYANL